jgi:hypothetical protein
VVSLTRGLWYGSRRSGYKLRRVSPAEASPFTSLRMTTSEKSERIAEYYRDMRAIPREQIVRIQAEPHKEFDCAATPATSGKVIFEMKAAPWGRGSWL